jgi:hypothetical protein
VGTFDVKILVLYAPVLCKVVMETRAFKLGGLFIRQMFTKAWRR